MAEAGVEVTLCTLLHTRQVIIEATWTHVISVMAVFRVFAPRTANTSFSRWDDATIPGRYAIATPSRDERAQRADRSVLTGTFVYLRRAPIPPTARGSVIISATTAGRINCGALNVNRSQVATVSAGQALLQLP
jgi:hypothetical protein